MSQAPLIAVSTGEPAGIGPDICVALARRANDNRLVFLGDPGVLASRAERLGLDIAIVPREAPAQVVSHEPGIMQILPVSAAAEVHPGRLDTANGRYVVEILGRSVDCCLRGDCDALVTAPVQKSVIAHAGIPFTGHTEFLAQRTGARRAVMLLTDGRRRVALVTTHMPLRAVPDAVSPELLVEVIEILDRDLRLRFAIGEPRILVLGLNPHAGEDATLGTEERDIIAPTLAALAARGFRLTGPVSADTAFTAESLERCDAVLAMYHDQGLTALKAQGFGEIVNVTLGLPIIRTSVDHGTALGLAGTGNARPDSLAAAIALAGKLCRGARGS
jgi:4-hydroxythreonine-4-phosphate dehydrogenase